MATRTRSLPPDGLYRTSEGLAGKGEKVRAGMLVYFQQRSGDGESPIVLLPGRNAHNKWRFRRAGFLVRDVAWVGTLQPLLSEGYYLTSEPMELTSQVKLGAYALVQLGYNREGDPIVFPARYEGNAIVFEARGKRFEDLGVFGRLLPAGFTRPLDGAHFEEDA